MSTYVPTPFGGVDGYTGVFALDARGEVTFQPADNHRFTGALALPLFAWVARSPYALTDSESINANRDNNGFKTFFRYIGRGKVRTWNQMQAVRLSAKYRYSLTPRWNLGAELESHVLVLSQPRPLFSHDHGLNLTVGYNF
jgi:hypothetical protein